MPNSSEEQKRLERFLSSDPYLAPHRATIARRIAHIARATRLLTPKGKTLADFASGHEYYGLHFEEGGWVLREWAPNATAMHLVGDLSDWKIRDDLALGRIDGNDTWQLRLPASQLRHKDLYRLHVQWPGGSGDRVPAWARRVV
ncbi:MAG: 1,4-alpha-glucan-branching enzyme, partial [Desulfatitalea sp.]